MPALVLAAIIIAVVIVIAAVVIGFLTAYAVGSMRP